MADNCDNVKEESSLPLEFQNGARNNLTNLTLRSLLNDLAPNSHENDMKKAMREIVNLYVTSKDHRMLHIEARNTIIELFSRFNGKKHLKKYAQDLVFEQDTLGSIIKESVEDILGKIKNENVCDVKQCNELLHFVSILQTSSKYNFDDNFRALFPLYISLFDGFALYASQIKHEVIPEVEEVNVLMNAVLKQILPVFTKNSTFLKDIQECDLQSLLMYSYVLLFNDKIGFDLRMKVCLVFVYSFIVVEGVSAICTQLLSKNDSQFNISINSNDEDKPSDYLIIIYSSILSVLPENKLISDTVDGKSLISVLFDGILETSKSSPGHSSVIIEASKTLCLIAKQFKKIPIELVKDMFLKGLYYVSCHIDYFVDTVRNYMKVFFEELVSLAAFHYANGYTEFTDVLIRKFEEIPDEGTMRFIAFENIAKYYGKDFLLNEFEHLPLVLLDCIDQTTNLDQVGKTYQMLVEESFDDSTPERADVWVKTWIVPVVNLLRSGQKDKNFCQKIISASFKLYPSILRMIFPNDYVGTVEESKVLLHCLCNARKSGIELSLEKDGTLYWRGLIDKQKMEMFMIHQNEEIRLLALASVAESLKSTELFLDWEFIFLINYIRYNISAQLPSSRKQIVTHYKNVLMRYDAGYKVIERNITKLTKALELNPEGRDQRFLSLYQELKKSYRRFICNLTRIFIGNLSYDSNYPRRATSLELLLIIHNILTPDEWRSCWTDDEVKNSHNILFDSFEGNKKMIVKLLKTLPPSYLGFTNVNFTCKYIKRSLELAVDAKPSKTLSAAYLFDICSYSPFFYHVIHRETGEEILQKTSPTLDMIILLSERFQDYCKAIKNDPGVMSKRACYGPILSIRHLLENRDISKYNDSYATIFKRTVQNCLNVSERVMPVVCNPSPEGYLPDYMDDLVEIDESPKAQKVLVYCWRTMKEMTLLLAEIVKQAIKLENEHPEMLPVELLVELGEFFVSVFVQSKHRGVFEQAYVGFSTICEQFLSSNRAAVYSLPKTWLAEALNLCTGKTQSDDLCATRRSAGLPFLILSILTTSSDVSLFYNAMTVLLKTAEDESKDCNIETKIHCLNVLRAIYRHSKLGELVATYISRGAILAIKGFKSEVWGVRNSSTLLFSALMVRLFGVQRTADEDAVCIKNKLTVKVFFLRYEPLYTFMLRTLVEECRNNSSLILQPILMILARLYPSNFDEEPCQVEDYLPCIDACVSNLEYKTREAAAKASVPLIGCRNINDHFDKCFLKISCRDIGDNECHGILLQMLYIIKNNPVRGLPLGNYIQQSLHICELAGKKFSHMTLNLYLELLTFLLYINMDFDDIASLKSILIQLSKQAKSNNLPLTWQESFSTVRILAYYIIINKFEETELTYSTITDEVMMYLYGGHESSKRFFLEFLIALNQMHVYYYHPDHAIVGADPPMESHPLFYTKDVEYRPSIANLVSTFRRTSIEKLLKHIHPYIKTFLKKALKVQTHIRSEDRVLLFLLLDYYPCAIKVLRLSKQETLNTLLNYCDCDNEELISAVISCISTFLEEMDYNLLRYDRLLEVLAKSASPAAAVHRRLTVCAFLCKNSALYCREEPVLKGDELCTAINIVMVLLEDEDIDVRNAMSNYENALTVMIKINNVLNQAISGHRWPVVPEKAKEDLIHLITLLLPQDKAVCMIFSWACRYFPDPSCETSEIFERGDLNQYAENTPLIDICSRVLIKMLWSLPEGLSYDDKSIFPEEQTQIVTIILLDSLMKYDSPMMLTKTKMSVICVLKSMYNFLENIEISSNFVTNFRTYLNDTILSYLTTHLEHGDLFCVKKIIRKLYDPVFRLRR